jgi:hypothetical protein
VGIADYEWADLIDKLDKIRTLYDPQNPYAEAGARAMARAMDDVIIEAALADAATGVTGGTTVALPDSQKLIANDGTNFSQLNVKTLRQTKLKFDEADVDDEDRYFVYSANDLYNLLGDTNITSADFNTVRALVNGEIDTFMGFKFVRSERLNTTAAAITTAVESTGAVTGGSDTLPTGAKRCFAFAKSGLLLSVGQDVITRVSERDDKSYSTQVFLSMSIGATRMEEKKVVEVLVAA